MIANIWLQLGIGAGGLIIGVAVGWFLLRAITGGTIRVAQREAQQLVSAAKTESESIKQKVELDAERDARQRRKELESEVATAHEELKKDQARLSKREDSIDQMMDQLTERQSKLDTAFLFANNGAVQRYDNPQFNTWRPEYSSIEDAAIATGKWQFSDGIAFIGNGTWELDGGTFSRGSIGAELDHGRDVRTYIEYRELSKSNDQFLSVGMNYELSKRYSLNFSPSWNFSTDELQSLYFALTRHYPEYDLIGQINFNEIQNETSYGIRFNLVKF